MKKIKTVSILLLFTLFVMSITSFAKSYELETQLNELSEETIVRVDNLIDERNEALLNNNLERYNELTDELRQQGTREISLDEIMNLIVDGTDFTYNNLKTFHQDSSVMFEESNFNYSLNGKTYKILKITATPKGKESVLYKTGNTAIKNSRPASAYIMPVLDAAVSSTLGHSNEILGFVKTAYDLLKESINIDSSTTITDIKAAYTWNTVETCSFIFIFDENIGSYKLGARYHKVSAAIGVSIPELVLDGSDSRPDIRQWSTRGSANPKNYDSVEKAIYYFNDSAKYTSSITTVDIKGIEGKSVESVSLRNPSFPYEVGY